MPFDYSSNWLRWVLYKIFAILAADNIELDSDSDIVDEDVNEVDVKVEVDVVVVVEVRIEEDIADSY